ncbi:MAG: glutamate-5-semialdehyde dehydrogenase [Holosporales bacterium]|jgi:glutamate-5-semialdehyde dehydrogenase|nr:glutamate-5-semialdehyde dehydrogenase [Holosporales bacterium]
MTVLDHIKRAKKLSYEAVSLKAALRDRVLCSLAQELHASTDVIIAENAKDLAALAPNDPMFDRLLLNKTRIENIATDIEKVATLPFSLGQVLEHKIMPNGLILDKVSVPLGVVAVIYESRPNVTLDVFSLCFKSGNSCVLRGGKDAFYSNVMLVKIIQKVLITYEIDPDFVYLLPPERENIKILLKATGFVDICIPRGGQSLIDFVRNNARVPVIETGAGIVHTYFDTEGDIEKGAKIINNAKTRRVSVCNALDCLIVHKSRLKDLYSLIAPLQESGVEAYADRAAYTILLSKYAQPLLQLATANDFGKEFLSYKMSIKTVDSVDEAIEHIGKYTSGHSEAIITENPDTAQYFVDRIDAAAVYINASTAFTDGAQFGMGIEVGISTQKLHARGPMALESLTSYKWIIHGAGHIRSC